MTINIEIKIFYEQARQLREAVRYQVPKETAGGKYEAQYDGSPGEYIVPLITG